MEKKPRKPLTDEQKKRASELAKAWIKANPERAKASRDRWNANNKPKLRETAKKWRQANPEKCNARIKAFYDSKPWYKSWQAAKSRCTAPGTTGYEWYGAKGIGFHLSQEDCKRMWERDGADNQDRPSLDRIDSSGGYRLENCRYIELVENCRQGGINSSLSKRRASLEKQANRHP